MSCPSVIHLRLLPDCIVGVKAIESEDKLKLKHSWQLTSGFCNLPEIYNKDDAGCLK